MTLVLLFVIAEVVSLITALKTSVVEYANSSCAPPALTVSFTSALTCTPQADHYSPSCVSGAGAYSVSDCTNYNQGGGDDFNIVNDAFDGYPYLGVEVCCGALRTLRFRHECYAVSTGRELLPECGEHREPQTLAGPLGGDHDV